MKLSSYPSIKLKSSSSQQLFLARSSSPQAASQLQAGRAWPGGGGRWGTIKVVRALALPEGMQENKADRSMVVAVKRRQGGLKVV